ncbi:hypothetical protein CI1B_16370 [Bradyrhizobium ivorense]|uniref:Uncharacterized protein n=1 Tax=Bradyrhizobium ivorense TaxID=2511166 RepID=A0A508SU75_9BRAD|nr:hypothetical protein [Bradyrhizobium ivorense]VIO66515.1 hypothetical protein CI1B_16370 [Bradyrhizobium ivorense]
MIGFAKLLWLTGAGEVIWDRLAGTYNRGPRFAELRYGLDGFDDAGKRSLRGLLKMPFMGEWGKPAAPTHGEAEPSASPPMLPWP